MDLGVIIFLLIIIGSSIYKHYKEQMEKSSAAKPASSVNNDKATGKNTADRILQNIISEIEKNRGTIKRSHEEDAREGLSAISASVKGDVEEKEVESAAEEFTEAESERDLPPEKINKGIVPDYKDVGSLSTGFIYATVLGEPACRKSSSFVRRRKF